MTVRPRLLIVDDEEPNRDMLARRLRRHGYDVDVAGAAVEGLSALDRTAFDLVLIDVQMPGISGLEMLRQLRQRFKASQLSVIMVTARRESEEVVEALDMGANDYITKPIDLPVALARIRTQIAHKQAEQALVESEERYALAVRGSKDGLWDWKIATGQMFCSPRWNQLLGYDDDAGVGTIERWLSRVHADDEGRVRAEVQDHLSGKSSSLESEHRVRQVGGQFRWVLARGIAVLNAAGEPIRMAGSLTDITEGKVADALTGLPNRVLFMDRLGRLLEYRRRLPEFEFAVLFVDLDRFKSVNDTMGHSAGDQLLIQAARRLELGLRASDTFARVPPNEPAGHPVGGNAVARLGGDEFGMLLSGIRQADEASRVAERIRQLLAEPFVIDGQDVFVSASIGIALSGPGYAQPADMLRDADTALYRAKASGRACFAVFDQAMREEVVERVKLEVDLRHAIEHQEFVVLYQPIVSLATGSVTSVEALVRWRHPERGMVGPREFIPTADETGLIVPLGYWVFNEVCRQWHSWSLLRPSSTPVIVAVNASARQLAQADFAEQIARIAERHGVPTGNLEIEMSEAAMLSNPAEGQAVLMRLKALGFRVSIDDFGAGYSSFTYLRRVPVDRLKIDPSLLDMQGQEPTVGSGILNSVIGLARHLDLEVVAEGIETPEQLEHLRRIDCGFGQGFVFLEAVGPDPMSRLLESGAQTPGGRSSHPAATDRSPVPAPERSSQRADLAERT